MATDPYQGLTATLKELAGTNPIEIQIKGEQAAGLGHHGRLMAVALERLALCDPNGPDRDDLFWLAVERVWHYFIQREACGLRDHRSAIAFYRIPGEVIARLGARRPATRGAEQNRP